MKTLLITLFTIISFNTLAKIECHSPKMNKIFEINGEKVVFLKQTFDSKNREIASVTGRNKNNEKGITKIVDFDQLKHTIHIEDKNNFSDFNDYIVIKNNLGHEITYSLTCRNK